MKQTFSFTAILTFVFFLTGCCDESAQDYIIIDSIDVNAFNEDYVDEIINESSFHMQETPDALKQLSSTLHELYKKIMLRVKQEPVNILSGKFSSKLKIFFARFKSDLTAKEIATWMNKLSFTSIRPPISLN